VAGAVAATITRTMPIRRRLPPRPPAELPAVRIVMLPHIFARSSPGPAVRSLRYAKVPVTLETVKFHRTWFAKFGDFGSDASAAELLL